MSSYFRAPRSGEPSLQYGSSNDAGVVHHRAHRDHRDVSVCSVVRLHRSNFRNCWIAAGICAVRVLPKPRTNPGRGEGPAYCSESADSHSDCLAAFATIARSLRCVEKHHNVHPRLVADERHLISELTRHLLDEHASPLCVFGPHAADVTREVPLCRAGAALRTARPPGAARRHSRNSAWRRRSCP
jgi:hypothetical protein